MFLQSDNLSIRGLTNDRKDRPAILATVLYEDLEAGLRARGLLEGVGANGDLALQFNLGLWRFDWLAEGSLGNVALGRANHSPLVLISASTANPLPGAAQKWINSWIHNRQVQPAALVVLLPKPASPDSPEHPLRQQLAEVAQQKKVDFFCEFFELPDPRHPTASPRIRVEKAAAGSDEALVNSGRTSTNIARFLHESNAHRRPTRAANGSDKPARKRTRRSVVSLRTAVRTSWDNFQVDPPQPVAIRFRTPGERPAGGARADAAPELLAGVAMAGLDAEARRQFGFARGFKGAWVTRIDTSSPAFKAGLRAGDVIQQMNESSAKTKLVASFPVSTVAPTAVFLRVWGRGGTRLVAVNGRACK